jgi:hypothetical protein
MIDNVSELRQAGVRFRNANNTGTTRKRVKSNLAMALESALIDNAARERDTGLTDDVATLLQESYTAIIGIGVFMYEFDSIPDAVVITEDTPQPVHEIALTDLPAGTYELVASLTFESTGTGDESAHFDYTLNGNTSNFNVSADADGHLTPFNYTFPMDHTGGDISLALAAYVDGTGTDELTIQASNLIIKRMK